MPNITMDKREKLIELIEEVYFCSIEQLADHLIAKGVTIKTQKVKPKKKAIIKVISPSTLDALAAMGRKAHGEE